MDTTKLMNLGIALGIVYAVYKFAPGQAAKAAALGVAGVMVARNVPYVKDQI